MEIARERLELYFPTSLEDADQLKGTVINASETYLSRVLGGNVNQQKLKQSGDSSLLLQPTVKSLMVPALRNIREEMAKTRILRIHSDQEGRLSFARNKLEANFSKNRGKKRRPVWGREGAVEFFAEEMAVTELEFASASLQRAIDGKPSERKKLVLSPSNESLDVIHDIQQTVLKGIRPALRRGIEIDERILENPVCEIADIDTSQSNDTQLRQFLDEVRDCLPIRLPVDKQISITFSSHGNSTEQT